MIRIELTEWLDLTAILTIILIQNGEKRWFHLPKIHCFFNFAITNYRETTQCEMSKGV